jgi:SAM-dependent methyltransferase
MTVTTPGNTSAGGAVNLFSRDRQGRLHIQNGQVRRKVVPELFEIFKTLDASGGLARLHEAGLVQTTLPADAEANVLAHEFVPFVTYPQEWTIEMLRDAAVSFLDVSIELAKSGLRFYDAHPWNVTFKNDRPITLDFSSILRGARYETGWPKSFFMTFHLPLWLWNMRLCTLARMIMREDHPAGATHGARATGRYLFHLRRLGGMALRYRWCAWRIGRARDPGAALLRMRNHIAHLRLPRQKAKRQDDCEPGGDYNDLSGYNEKARAVRTMLEKLAPGRVLDLACKHGWYTGLATRFGHSAMGVDMDDNAVNVARQTRAGKFNFTVACMNLLWPTPPQGRFLHLPSVFQRWQCDTALMIALTHRLALRQSIRFDALAAMPAAFGASNVIIEWIPPEDASIQRWMRHRGDVPTWYREEEFVAALAQRWPAFERVPFGVRDGQGMRQMYLFRK